MFVEFYFSLSHIPFVLVFNRLDLFLSDPVDDQTTVIPDLLCPTAALAYLAPNHEETEDQHLPFRPTQVVSVLHCFFLILQIRLMSYIVENYIIDYCIYTLSGANILIILKIIPFRV